MPNSINTELEIRPLRVDEKLIIKGNKIKIARPNKPSVNDKPDT